MEDLSNGEVMALREKLSLREKTVDTDKVVKANKEIDSRKDAEDLEEHLKDFDGVAFRFQMEIGREDRAKNILEQTITEIDGIELIGIQSLESPEITVEVKKDFLTVCSKCKEPLKGEKVNIGLLQTKGVNILHQSCRKLSQIEDSL